MLPFPPQQAANQPHVGGIGAATTTGDLLDDDMMDPLFDDDWLHEHNLDILFDLFEEEIESKGVDANNGSSTTTTTTTTIFGSSPVTSYLLGSPPTLALDLYDLLFLDNQQTTASATNAGVQQHPQQQPNHHHRQQQQQQQQQQQHAAPPVGAHGATTTTNTNNVAKHVHHKPAANRQEPTSKQRHQQTTVNPITNAMRIKRGLKRGQSEGISLLAKPNSIQNTNSASSSPISTSYDNHNTLKNSNNKISDKTSAKITNFRKSIIGTINNGTDVSSSSKSGRALAGGSSACNEQSGGSNSSGSNDNNNNVINSQQHNQRQKNSRHLYHYHHHIHYITGCSIILEHAYALRGH